MKKIWTYTLLIVLIIVTWVHAVTDVTSVRNIATTAMYENGNQVYPIPSGAIAFFETSCPNGWTRLGAADNRYIRGDTIANKWVTGDSSHSHSISPTISSESSHTHSFNFAATSLSDCSTVSHTHTVSDSISSSLVSNSHSHSACFDRSSHYHDAGSYTDSHTHYLDLANINIAASGSNNLADNSGLARAQSGHTHNFNPSGVHTNSLSTGFSGNTDTSGSDSVSGSSGSSSHTHTITGGGTITNFISSESSHQHTIDFASDTSDAGSSHTHGNSLSVVSASINPPYISLLVCMKD
jgi:hypothetical protein